MLFKATNEQVLEVAALAFNASKTNSNNRYYNKQASYKAADFLLIEGKMLKLDVVQGRDINLTLVKKEEDVWETPFDAPVQKSQSWSKQFRTYEALIGAVKGTEVIVEKKFKR